MHRLELKVPPPLIMLISALVMWLLFLSFPAFTVTVGGGLAMAVIVGLAGLVISAAGVIRFRHAQTTIDPRKPADTSVLVTSGIYRCTRNPMYLGTLLVLMGWGLFLGNILSLIVGSAAFVAYINRFQIQPEERMLQGKFGAEFTDYKNRVRRWL